MEQQQMDLFEDGGLRDQGGGKDPVSGNDVPVGSLEKEVRDDIPAMLSEGEFIFPADVVRYWGLDLLMQMRQEAKQGLKKMEDMGQMGNSEEATLPDDMPFNMDDIETGDEPAFKFNVGGLAADPRFVTQNVNIPTYTEEDKKEIETAVLGGIFGDITMKRYVNADGKVIYIPFIGDKPQAPIPEGFTLDESPVVSSPSTAQATMDSGDSGGGSTYDPALSPLDKALQQPDMPKVKSIDINKMSPEELVAYYESFTSPMAKFASYGAGLLFGPLIGVGIGLAQQWSIKNGPNSFVNTEKRLAELISKGELKDAGLIKRITDARKRAKEKGVGPVSLLSKISEKLGLSKGPNADILTKDLANAIKNGVLPKNAKEIFNQTDAITEAFKDIDPETKKLIDQYTGGRGIPADPDADYLEASGAATATFPSATPATNFNYDTVPEFGEGQPVQQPVRLEPTSGLQTKIDPVTGETKEGDPFAPIERAKVESTKPVDPFAVTPDQFVPDYGFDPKDQKQAKKERRIDRRFPITKIFKPEIETKYGVEQDKKIKQKPAYTAGDAKKKGEPIPTYDLSPQQDDEDRPETGEQNYGDLTGSPFDDTGPSTYTPTSYGYTPPSYDQLTGSPFDNTGPSTSYGTDSGFGYGGSDVMTPFYVGGVPTKPMKPQRLKKGGLAKPKVKPKRMKKGGLASKK
tara:strand:+ start:213 stop:2276 length:2064 start_codon:yes stop_codon:yes gene_type:complete